MFNTISLIFVLIFGELKILPKSIHIPGETSACPLTQMQAEDGQVAVLTSSGSNGFTLSAFLFCALVEWVNYPPMLKYLPADAVNDFICHH